MQYNSKIFKASLILRCVFYSKVVKTFKVKIGYKLLFFENFGS